MNRNVIATIGVIDDDPGIRTALSQLLRSAGYGVSAFESAEEFLSSERREAVDCLLVDVNLPAMNGVDLLQVLSREQWAKPAVLMTARDDPATLELLRRAAPVPRLRKPFSDTELFNAIEQARIA